jgi:hypothetical protein
MPIRENELIAIVKNPPTLVREDDGSLTLIFQNSTQSPWKVSVPLTQLRAEDNATVFNGSLTLATDLPAYIVKHLHTLETQSDGELCTIGMTFRGASSPESRYMRKSFEHFVRNHTVDLGVSRAANCVIIMGTPMAINTLLNSLNEKRNEHLISWTASTLYHQDNARQSEQQHKPEIN